MSYGFGVGDQFLHADKAGKMLDRSGQNLFPILPAAPGSRI